MTKVNDEQRSRVKVVLNSDADNTPVQTEVFYPKKSDLYRI